MGYQVGNQCFVSLEEAQNHYFSLVTPVVSANGQLIKPEYDGQNWVLNGQILNLKLPECDPLKNFSDGAQLGWLIVGLLASLYVFNILRRLLK